MSGIKTEFLFTIALEVEVLNLGDTPYGSRRVGRFGTGSFEGPKLNASRCRPSLGINILVAEGGISPRPAGTYHQRLEVVLGGLWGWIGPASESRRWGLQPSNAGPAASSLPDCPAAE
jgi:hypothetical protein